MAGNETPKIRVLDPATINQIAAGEVVERPASVVKELVENAIDAGAATIRIDITSVQGGISSIRVTDDGCGMTETDARLAFAPHATSKITELDDLFTIRTLGFRGEALASIASVAKVTLVTKPRGTGAVAGTKIINIGGKIEGASSTGVPEGTSILVEELFFNTPARKKFQKNLNTELARIHAILEGIFLSCPGITFRFYHNNREQLVTDRTGRALDTITRIFGSDCSRELVPVSAELPFMKISGYISRPALTRKDKDRVLVSINNRFITSLPITSAIREGYGTLLFRDRYPVAFLSLEIDTRLVDVNVHPTKKEVRLSREKEICEGIRDTVRSALHAQNLIPDAVVTRREQELQIDREPSKTVTSPVHSHPVSGNSRDTPKEKAGIAPAKISPSSGFVYEHETTYDTETSRASDFRTGNHPALPGEKAGAADYREYGNSSRDLFKESIQEKSGIAEPTHTGTHATDHRLRQTELATGVIPETSLVPELAVIGQVGGIYILAEGPDGELFIIDQHAAHERIYYEKVSRSTAARHIQELITPELIHRSPKDAALLRDLIPTLADQGVIIEDFGSDSFLVRAVPAIMGKIEGPGMIDDLVSDLLNPDPARPVTDRERITRIIACRSAIKAGTVCTQEQCQRLIDQLRMTQSPYTCPHGRPTIIRFPRVKLDEMFKRI